VGSDFGWPVSRWVRAVGESRSVRSSQRWSRFDGWLIVLLLRQELVPGAFPSVGSGWELSMGRARAVEPVVSVQASSSVYLSRVQKANYMFKPTPELSLRLLWPYGRRGLTWR
jgi:hypothetical protein